MKRNKMMRDAIGLTGTGMVLGIGGSLPGAGAGAEAMASMMPSIGSAMGGGYAINAMMGMVPKKRRK